MYIYIYYVLYIIRIAQFPSGGFLKRGILNWVFILKCSDETDDLGVPTFQETSKCMVTISSLGIQLFTLIRLRMNGARVVFESVLAVSIEDLTETEA